MEHKIKAINVAFKRNKGTILLGSKGISDKEFTYLLTKDKDPIEKLWLCIQYNKTD